MKLSFKMKVKLGIWLAFAFIIALVIHEDHAGVVLRKFQPKRALSAEKLSNSSIKPISQAEDQFIIKNSTNNKNETEFKTNKVHSFVVYEEVLNSRTNSSKNEKHFISNFSKSGRNLFEEKSQIASTLQKSKFSTEKNDSSRNHFSQNHLDLKDSRDSYSNETDPLQQHKVLRSLEFEVSDNSTEVFLNISDKGGPVSLNNSIIKFREGSINNSNDFTLGKQPKINLEVDQKRNNLSNDLKLNDFNRINDDLIPSNITRKVTDGSKETSISSLTKVKVGNDTEDKMVTKEIGKQVKDHNTIQNVDKTKSDKETEEKVVQKDGKNASKQENSHEMTANDDEAKSVNKTSIKWIKKNRENTSKQENSHEMTANDTEAKSVTETEEKLLSEDSGIALTQADDPKMTSNFSIEGEVINESFLNESGLESIVSVGLDFLSNSEVAKNAALAMEIFNLSDSSITDHIIDDSDSMAEIVRPLTEEDSSIKAMNESLEENVNQLVEAGNKKCPSQGICVFWFMARNTCDHDDQCLGSKICCRIRCSKQCIDV